MNACIDNEYGKEGIIKHKYKVGDEFDIRIRSHEEEFEIYLDHKLVARFAHYRPLVKCSLSFVFQQISNIFDNTKVLRKRSFFVFDLKGKDLKLMQNKIANE